MSSTSASLESSPNGEPTSKIHLQHIEDALLVGGQASNLTDNVAHVLRALGQGTLPAGRADLGRGVLRDRVALLQADTQLQRKKINPTKIYEASQNAEAATYAIGKAG